MPNLIVLLALGLLTVQILNGIHMLHCELSYFYHAVGEILCTGESVPCTNSTNIYAGNSTCGHVTQVIVQGGLAGPQGERGEHFLHTIRS